MWLKQRKYNLNQEKKTESERMQKHQLVFIIEHSRCKIKLLWWTSLR